MFRQKWMILTVVVVLVSGLFTAWMARRADQQMRAELLIRTQLVAGAIDTARVNALTGTEADLLSGTSSSTWDYKIDPANTANNIKYRSSSYPGRKKYNTTANDKLIVRGTLTEAIRGIVGNGTNGYIKQYYYDQRITSGILPSNIWLKGKYILIPGGWSESSIVKSN